MFRRIQTGNINSKKKFYHEKQKNLHKITLFQNTIPNHNVWKKNYREKFKTLTKYQSIEVLKSQFSQEKETKISCTQNDQIDIINYTEKLEKKIQHILGSIKELFNNSGVEKKKTNTLLNLLSSNFFYLSSNLCKSQKERDQLNRQYSQQIKQYGHQIKKYQSIIQSFKPSKHRLMQKKEDTQAYFKFQNIRLQQLNECYLFTLKKLQNEAQVEVLQNVNNHQNDDNSYHTELLRHKRRITYLQMKLSTEQIRSNELVKNNEELKDKILQMKKQINRLDKENASYSQKIGQWRERIMMSQEDNSAHFIQDQYLHLSVRKLRMANKILTQKMQIYDKLDKEKAISQESHSFDNMVNYQDQADFIRHLKTVYFEGKHKEMKIHIEMRKKNTPQLTSIELQNNYLEYQKYQNTNLSMMAYLRPPFQFLLNDSFLKEKKNNGKNHTSVSRMFIQVLRAIMMSKSKQLFMNSEEKYSHFPQFVYQWFQNFYYNSEKNQICGVEPFMLKSLTLDSFYTELMNPKLDQSWQIITFREFLLQQLSLEQLYFYLMCQNLLFRRAGITRQMIFQGSCCILIQYKIVKTVLDTILSDFQSWNISFLASKLREKIFIRFNVQYIDSSFFLRCLLEYYKIQRINRLKYICKLCQQLKNIDNQSQMNFNSFLKVINHFNQVPISKKVRLYRDCYSVSQGKITDQVIFTVCSEQLIFLKYLRLKCFYRVPNLIQRRILNQNKSQNDSSQKQLICLQPSHPYLYSIFINFKNLLKSPNFMSRIKSLGVADMYHKIKKVEKLFFDKSGYNDSSILKCKHFLHWLLQSINCIRQLNFDIFYELLDQQSKKKNNKSFWVEILETNLCDIIMKEFQCTFKVYEKLQGYRIWKDKVYEFRINIAAKRIQRTIRRKLTKPYKLIYQKIVW